MYNLDSFCRQILNNTVDGIEKIVSNKPYREFVIPKKNGVRTIQYQVIELHSVLLQIGIFLGSINIVRNPFDRYAIVKLEGTKFSFDLLDYIVPKIEPYSKWSYIIENRLLPEYKSIGRNDRCPCGSGKKFKHCIRDDANKHYEDHYIFSIG